MGLFGTILQTASIGLGALNSIVNGQGGAQAQFGSAKEFHCEMTDGKRWAIVSQYVVHSNNTALIGRTFTPGAVGVLKVPADPNEDPIADGSVVFQTAQDAANNTKFFAINTTTDTPYVANFSTTESDGSNPNNAGVVIPPASNKYKPEWVDVSDLYSNHVNGNIGVAPADLPVDPTVLDMLARLGIKPDNLATSTLLANYGVNNVVASATYKLVNNPGQLINWKWVSDPNTAQITGATVTNTGPSVKISGSFHWDNPLYDINQAITVNGSTTNGGVTTFTFNGEIPNTPLKQASLAVVLVATPAEQKAHFARVIQAQRDAGRMYTVKYMYV